VRTKWWWLVTAVGLAAAMPTMYRWDYDDPETGGVQMQGSYAGDLGHDDGFGLDGVINFLEGAYLNMTFEIDGEKVTKNRTCGHIRALQCRLTAATERPERAPTGRPGQALGGLYQFMGTSGAAVNPTTPAARPQPKKAFGKAVPKKQASAKAAAPAAASGKRKAREPPLPVEVHGAEEDADGAAPADEAGAGEAAGSGVNSLAQLGADYAETDDSDAEEAAPGRQEPAC
jgi:hypothetical protein